MADTPDNRIERVLAFMVVSITGVSIIAFVAIMIGSASRAPFDEGVWPAVLLLPGIGLPIAFVLIVTLLVVNLVRRRRAGDAGR